jgi:hypothetical protein
MPVAIEHVFGDSWSSALVCLVLWCERALTLGFRVLVVDLVLWL